MLGDWYGGDMMRLCVSNEFVGLVWYFVVKNILRDLCGFVGISFIDEDENLGFVVEFEEFFVLFGDG